MANPPQFSDNQLFTIQLFKINWNWNELYVL